MTDERARSFFVSEGDHFVPTRAARGYWQKGTLSGSAAASLLGHVIERDCLDPDWVPVRLSVDMLRMPPDAPLSVAVEVLHESGRVRLVEARLIAEGRVQTRAQCQIVRRGVQPDNPLWQSPPWPAPHPDTLPRVTQFARWDMRPIPAGAERFARDAPVQGHNTTGNPPVLGVLAAPSTRQTWLSSGIEVVAGNALSPWLMLVTTADFASPLTHSSEFGIDFVNTDFTVHIHRLPQGEWIGFELVGHSSADGVAMGQAAIHDVAGPLGVIAVSAIANSRRAG
ncbi:thioesterase family protein [Novosphingobium sp.]|uniref:thioesterase family protein n=1 Tax=Novosphingobium sp. TaxID=1874826 RepID=UPI00333E55A5